MGRADIAGIRLEGEIHLLGATWTQSHVDGDRVRPFNRPPGPVTRLMSADNDVTGVRQLMHISAKDMSSKDVGMPVFRLEASSPDHSVFWVRDHYA
jgi:hypothetical protein